jgi:hypothetical protein
MTLSFQNKIIIAFIFSVAMAFLESAVVVYLRFLLYGGGFDFPLTDMKPVLIATELGRELATIIMLWAVGYMLAKTRLSRFAWFLFCFAVWDIFYYVFLYVLLGWPATLLDWDILFLIPVAWYGPVITPCLVSGAMILLALVITWHERKGALRSLRKREWGTMLIGCFVILFTFMWPFVEYAGWLNSANWHWPDGTQLVSAGLSYVPKHYNWTLFVTGYALLLAAIAVYWHRIRTANKVLY